MSDKTPFLGVNLFQTTSYVYRLVTKHKMMSAILLSRAHMLTW